jgi:hypothetical protein
MHAPGLKILSEFLDPQFHDRGEVVPSGFVRMLSRRLPTSVNGLQDVQQPDQNGAERSRKTRGAKNAEMALYKPNSCIRQDASELLLLL